MWAHPHPICFQFKGDHGTPDAHLRPTLVKKSYFHLFQPFQALGVPGRVNSSGYIVVNSTAMDAQVLVTVDASTLRGLLVLSTTEVRVQTRMAWDARAKCS